MIITRYRSNPTSIAVLITLIFTVSMAVGFAGGAYAQSAKAQSAGLAGVAVTTDALAASFPSPLTVISSEAALTRDPESFFGSFPSSGDPQALTVDQSTGDIYVVNPGSGIVSRFTAAGAPDDFTSGSNPGTNILGEFYFESPSAAQVAVAPAGAMGDTAGDIYVASYFGVNVYANDGEFLGQITEANGAGFSDCGVATDNTGRVYIGDFGGSIDRYMPSANPATNGDYDSHITGVSNPCNLAADSTGAVYASTWPTGPLTKYAASDFGTSDPGTVIDATSHAVAVDPSTDDVYVDEGNKISSFDSTGTLRYSFGSEAEFGSESDGVAVSPGHGDVYVADSLNHRVDVYGPTASTDAASGVGHVKAVLNGHLDPNGGEITDCHFDWGTTSAYGNTIPCSQGGSYTTAGSVSATLTGLEPGNTYHYRLVVANDTNTVAGQDQAFETVRVPVIHSLVSAFGASGGGDGQLSGNSGVAVDQASGDVYVADTANHRVEEFDANGAFAAMFGWGVKDGKSEAQTCTSGCQAGIAGSGAGQLAAPTFIAVDNSGGSSSGDVYVGDTTNNTVTKYDANGNFIATNDGTASGSAFGPLAGVAVDHDGNLWVYDMNGDMREFAQSGVFTTKWNSGFGVTPAGIAVDSGGTLYIVRGFPVVERIGSTGVDEGQVTGGSPPEFNGPTTGLTIDPTSGDLYADDGGKLIRQYSNPSTCKASSSQSEGCPTSDVFGNGDLKAGSGLAVNASTGRVYVSDPDTVKIFDRATPPEVSTGAATASSPTSAVLNGTVTPNGVPLTDCHFEYVSDAAFLATGFTDLSSGGSTPCAPGPGSIAPDLESHQVTATITGLYPTTIYHFRLVAANAKATIDGQETLIPGPPLVQTTGSSTRTTTTARLDSRLDPRGAATSYHFEYGDQGPCDTNPCVATPAQAAGDGDAYELVSQQVSGLEANTTYHYRLVAENGIPAGVAYGQDGTVTTRASDAPLTHGHFPGPPGSDRAWEQVSMPDTSGNPVTQASSLSDDGERVVYTIEGGSPGSQYGDGLFGGQNPQYAERTSSGWQTKSLYPLRSESPGNEWPAGYSFESGGQSGRIEIKQDSTGAGAAEVWRMEPGVPARRVVSVPAEELGAATVLRFDGSADGSRVLMILLGDVDPEHTAAPGSENLYDVTTGTPHMVGLLPDGSVPSCGVSRNYMPEVGVAGGLITPEGSYAFFFTPPPGDTCTNSVPALYVRDLVNSTTVEIAADARFIRSTASAVFFTTTESLVAGDAGGNDIYRYTLDSGSIDCLTCSTPAAGAVISATGSTSNLEVMAVSEDGSRIYFTADHRLVQGATKEGIYRLDVSSGDLAYVAPAEGATVTGNGTGGDALTPDGSVFVFLSHDSALDAVNGLRNAGTSQFYRYDDNDGSLVCVSCPGDGSSPLGPAYNGGGGALTSNGDGYVFTTPTPLVPEDQNTVPAGQDPEPGEDVYEWRDGRQLLISDGQTHNVVRPQFSAMSPDGSNVFFYQAARLTPDTLNVQVHLFDARIGGGFQFPSPPELCSLEACQGTASPPPDDATPASLSFSGPGNTGTKGSAPASKCVTGKCVKKAPQKGCAKGKVRVRGKCVKKRVRKHAKRVNRNRGGAK